MLSSVSHWTSSLFGREFNDSVAILAQAERLCPFIKMFEIFHSLPLGSQVQLSMANLTLWREAGIFLMQRSNARALRAELSQAKFLPLSQEYQLSIQQMRVARPLDDREVRETIHRRSAESSAKASGISRG